MISVGGGGVWGSQVRSASGTVRPGEVVVVLKRERGETTAR